MTDLDEFYKLLGVSQTQKKTTSFDASSFLLPTKPKMSANAFVRSLAKPQPKPTVWVRKPKVFVSFDYENDRHYKLMLDAWDANKRFDFTCKSHTPSEIQSEDTGRIKAVLTTKVKEATHVIVLVGKYANQIHPDANMIGFRNWINLEVNQARLYNKKVICVMLDMDNTLPEQLKQSGAKLVRSFNEKEIIEALRC